MFIWERIPAALVVPVTHLEVLLEGRPCIRRSGWGLRFCISHSAWGAGPRTTLGRARPYATELNFKMMMERDANVYIKKLKMNVLRTVHSMYPK